MKPARPQSATSRSLAVGMRAVGAMALALTLASCSLFGGGTRIECATIQGAPGQADPSIVDAAPAELRSFYSQQIDWKPCEAGAFQCAKVKVPLDYAKPDGDRIELAAIKLATRATRRAPCWSTRAGRAARATTSSGTRATPTFQTRSAPPMTSWASTPAE